MDDSSLFTFGSMSLGRNPADITSDLAVARRAMEAGVWFHSSPTYNQGFTYMVLRQAFDADRARRPKLILKIRDGNAALMRFEVEDSCRRLGLDAIDVAQLVSMDPALIDQLRGHGGPLADELASLRQRGLIRRAVLFLTPTNSDAGVEAAQNALIDGVIFYWNLTQRECSAAAWDAIHRHQIPVLALRTLGGGSADKNTAARAAALRDLIAAADCPSHTHLALRQAATDPVVRTTIGGTASLPHLEEYLAAAATPQPLPPEILSRIASLQAAS
jgi:aryl-alcohol dehydrogenase-like predicted oxidoreductase